MSSGLKILLIILGIIGFVLLISGGIVKNNMPMDKGRGDIVHSEVGSCLMSIGTTIFLADVLFLSAHLIEKITGSEGCLFVALKWFCIVGGILAIILSIIIAPIMASKGIQEYDRLYGSLVEIYHYFI